MEREKASLKLPLLSGLCPLQELGGKEKDNARMHEDKEKEAKSNQAWFPFPILAATRSPRTPKGCQFLIYFFPCIFHKEGGRERGRSTKVRVTT